MKPVFTASGISEIWATGERSARTDAASNSLIGNIFWEDS